MNHLLIYTLIVFLNITNIKGSSVIELTFKASLNDLNEKIKNNKQTPENNNIFSSFPHAADEAFSMYNNSFSHQRDKYQKIISDFLIRSTQGIDHIIVYYKGIASVSDENGIVLLPRLEHDRLVYLLITTDIFPVKAIEKKSPLFFKLNNNAIASYFKITGLLDETGNKIEWNIENIELPKEKISEQTIIIFGDPNIFKFESSKNKIAFSENIIIPTLFVDRKAIRGIYELRSFDIKKYFHELAFIKGESLDKKQEVKKIGNGETTTIEIPNQGISDNSSIVKPAENIAT